MNTEETELEKLAEDYAKSLSANFTEKDSQFTYVKQDFKAGYRAKEAALSEQQGKEVDNDGAELILADRATLINKVKFYREQTEKIRQFIHDNKIGKPTQGFFDAILEHLQEQQGNSEAVEFAEWIDKNVYTRGLNSKWYKIPPVFKGEQSEFTTEELYKLFKQSKL